MSRRAELRAELVSAAILLVVKSLVSAFVLALGFHAVSDDDFARVFIAQEFAAAPSLDPSGTSWLPLPFWVQGSVMAALGDLDFGTARATSFGLGILSIWAVFLAGRWLGLNRHAALCGALVACLVPYVAILGVATVPEEPTAAALVLGLASLARPSPGLRSLGAVALTAAALSRYEAWPVAGMFSMFCIVDSVRQKRPALVLPALLALSGPVCWMLHGAFTHGSPTFFIDRVAAYRRAVNNDAQSIVLRLITYPRGFLFGEPELTTLTLAAVWLARRLKLDLHLEGFRRPALIGAALLGVLVYGDLRDGAPTHHPERAVMALWLLLALCLGATLAVLVPALQTNAERLRATAVGLLTLACAVFLWRPWFSYLDDFVDRRSALEIGRAARQAKAQSIVVDTPDFGFFAVQVGRADPTAVRPLDDRDPRKLRPPNPFTSPTALSERLRREQARWLITRSAHEPMAAQVGDVVARNDDYALVRVDR